MCVCECVCVVLRTGKQNSFHSSFQKKKEMINPDLRDVMFFDSQFFWKLPCCPYVRKSFGRSIYIDKTGLAGSFMKSHSLYSASIFRPELSRLIICFDLHY